MERHGPATLHAEGASDLDDFVNVCEQRRLQLPMADQADLDLSTFASVVERQILVHFE